MVRDGLGSESVATLARSGVDAVAVTWAPRAVRQLDDDVADAAGAAEHEHVIADD